MSKLIFRSHYHPDNVCNPVIPRKAYPSDIGYDLTLVREVKTLNENTVMYDSSISVIPPFGYYIEIVPRSSLSKYGYMMANSIGIVDPSYQGTLKVVMTKVVDSAESILLPLTRFQLILRKIHDCDTEVQYIESDDNNNNAEIVEYMTRGTGGFGSTD